MVEPVIKEIEVSCNAARAFEVFVSETTKWWPMDKHSVSAGAGETSLSVTIEPNTGGAVYETMFDGSRAEWGKVLTYEAGRHLAMTWHPGTNAESPTKVELWFEDLPEGRAMVRLVHSGWEVWEGKAQDIRNGYNNGWVFVFEAQFAQACR